MRAKQWLAGCLSAAAILGCLPAAGAAGYTTGAFMTAETSAAFAQAVRAGEPRKNIENFLKTV